MTRFRDAKVCNNWLQIRIERSQNTVWLQVQKRTTKSRRKEICIWYYVCVVKPSTTQMTTWPARPRTPSTQRTWTSTRECAVLLVVSQVLVVMIHTLHHLAQVCLVRACHVHTWSERISSALSPPFPSTSSSSHSSFISCTSSTTLRAVASLCTPPKRLWTLLTTPTSSQDPWRRARRECRHSIRKTYAKKQMECADEIMCSHLGQEGIQVGNACWKVFCLEQGMSPHTWL